MKRILLSMIVLSVVMMADFSRNSAGVVTDSTTGLQWQDDYSDNGGEIKYGEWQPTIDYCEALILDGHDDWRLPNIRELASLADYTRYDPAIDTTVFIHTASYSYWSSSTVAGRSVYAWLFNFKRGHRQAVIQGDGYKHDDFVFYVRCVRAGE